MTHFYESYRFENTYQSAHGFTYLVPFLLYNSECIIQSALNSSCTLKCTLFRAHYCTQWTLLMNGVV